MDPMPLREFQRRIEALYFTRDEARGIEGTFAWFVEEVGELSRALRRRDRENLREEFADCLAWLSTLASLSGVDLEEAAVGKYGSGCPRCGKIPCGCPAHPGGARAPSAP
jgi:NTP pyrophosphatase (non-canonical NTP hydrolase)